MGIDFLVSFLLPWLALLVRLSLLVFGASFVVLVVVGFLVIPVAGIVFYYLKA